MHDSWVATSYGALDIRQLPSAADSGIECMLLPILPASEPIGLQGEVAALWRRLVASPVTGGELQDEQLALVREFETFGLATRDLHHPARTTAVSTPWLSSPLHELVYALVANLAKASGVRVVFIKGPVLHLQGIRKREHSGDVDLWVDPDGVATLRDGLVEWGWTVLPSVWQGPPLNHSVALRPEGWGCEVDIHFDLPGIARPGSETFQLLRQLSEPVTFASTTVAVPSAPAHSVIYALHTLRPRVAQARPAALDAEVANTLRLVGTSVVGAAQRLRADAALAPALAAAFPDEFNAPGYEPPLNWRWRLQPTRIRGYLMLLGGMPLVDQVRFLLRLAWPERDASLAADVARDGRAHSVFGARVRRLLRGIRKSLADGQRNRHAARDPRGGS